MPDLIWLLISRFGFESYAGHLRTNDLRAFGRGAFFVSGEMSRESLHHLDGLPLFPPDSTPVASPGHRLQTPSPRAIRENPSRPSRPWPR